MKGREGRPEVTNRFPVKEKRFFIFGKDQILRYLLVSLRRHYPDQVVKGSRSDFDGFSAAQSSPPNEFYDTIDSY